MDDDPTYDIAVTRAIEHSPPCETWIREAIEAALCRHATRTARINVVLTDNKGIARLNERYLNRKGPTDVLAFDLRDDPAAPGRPGSQRARRRRQGPEIEGEIVVSVDMAAREARKRGHRVEAELALYALHGALHLMDYDDRSETDAARMHGVEDEVLAEIGLGAVYGG